MVSHGCWPLTHSRCSDKHGGFLVEQVKQLASVSIALLLAYTGASSEKYELALLDLTTANVCVHLFEIKGKYWNTEANTRAES